MILVLLALKPTCRPDLVQVSARLHRVCLVDGVGAVLRSYGGAPGAAVDQLSNPTRLWLVAGSSSSSSRRSVPRQHVLVADWGNNRVMAVDTTWATSSAAAAATAAAEMTVFVAPDDGIELSAAAAQLRGPNCLCVDERLGRMYVGETRGRRLMEFSFLVGGT